MTKSAGRAYNRLRSYNSFLGQLVLVCNCNFLYNRTCLTHQNTFVSVEPSKSKLSADAKEWYPPNYTRHVPTYTPDPASYRPQRFSVQGRLRQAQDQNPYNLEEMSYSLDEAENMDLRVCIFKY